MDANSAKPYLRNMSVCSVDALLATLVTPFRRRDCLGYRIARRMARSAFGDVAVRTSSAGARKRAPSVACRRRSGGSSAGIHPGSSGTVLPHTLQSYLLHAQQGGLRQVCAVHILVRRNCHSMHAKSGRFSAVGDGHHALHIFVAIALWAGSHPPLWIVVVRQFPDHAVTRTR